WCGTAGLAAHLPLALGLVPAAPLSPGRPQTVPHRQPPAERLLVIAGSLHPATAAQTAALARAGWEHLSVPIDRPPPATLRADLARAMEQHRYVVLALHRGALSEGDVQELARQPGAAERALQPLVQAVQGASWLGPGLGLIVTGGETALQLCRSWGATSIEITGEALPGIPLGRLQLPQGSVPLATKSGGFGAPDALLETARALL
ncbi:MAG TPA: nucleotide-binding domain containing protein, partial [Chloroflexota bacterium]|nr:nucleotide-binding domain containing protein [Chloroflexota bacterium]